MNYRDFARVLESEGLTAKECDHHHWQIQGGKRLVNVWANSKKGFRFQVRDQKSRIGCLADAIDAAGPPERPVETDPPWEAQEGTRKPGVIRRLAKWLW